MEYYKLIDSYKEDMIRTLAELVAIPSEEAAPVTLEDGSVLPFGENIHCAMTYVLDMAEKDGFQTASIDNFAGHLDFGGDAGEESEIMGILAHVDVVPAGSGWSSPPFEATLRNGRIYGRGTADDKGPLLAVYFAMKALKEWGFQPSKKVRLIVGLDEETSWQGMNYYMKTVRKPDFGFTPDADFPVIHGEKGNLVFRLEKRFSQETAAMWAAPVPSESACLTVTSISGGTAPNIVPNFASAVFPEADLKIISSITELADAYNKITHHNVSVVHTDSGFEIHASGTAAHSARPETGLNAVSILMDFLQNLPLHRPAKSFISFFNRCIGFQLDGESMGCGLQDKESGKLVFNVGKLQFDASGIIMHINIRYPVTYSTEQVYAAMKPVLDAYGFTVQEERHLKPLYVPKEDPFIQTLMEIYQQHTGDFESQPMVKNYSSYAKAAEGIVAFGSARFNDEPETAHEKDENIAVDTLMRTCKMYADVIYRCCK